ncbi:MAG: hypothetical protein JXO49_10980 [Deltaproteobacteria bacterium]|nr:hypothetical protein [Candidatus Anaeroferrophillus wilburensis]MBN2889856.1 hypothetical protein [Deltaproteobacteria bacterium]
MIKKISILLSFLLFFYVAMAVPAARADRSEEEIAKVAIGAYQDGFYDVAREELEDFLIAYPNSYHVAQIKLILLMTYLQLGECREASVIWPELAKEGRLEALGFSPPQLLFQLGLCFFQELDFPHADLFFQEIIQSYPTSGLASQAHFLLAKMAFHQGKFAVAVDHALPFVTGDDGRFSPPQQKELLSIASLSCYRIGKFAEALPLLRSYCDRYADGMDPPAKQYYFKVLVDASLKGNQVSIANQVMDQWLAEFPQVKQDADLLFAVGQENYRHQQYDAARKYLLLLVAQEGIKLEQHRLAYGYLVNGNLATGRQQDMVSLLIKLIPLEEGLPEQSQHLKLLATLSYNSKNYVQCVTSLDQLLEHFPATVHDDDILLTYLMAQSVLGKYQQALANLPPADRLFADLGGEKRQEAAYLYALCLEQASRQDDAFLLLRKLYGQISQREEKIKVLYVLDRLSQKMGDAERAAWVAKQVLQEFSLDRRTDEQLLKEYPHLVFSVARYFYRQQEYGQAVPSLLWLKGLPVQPSQDFFHQALFLLGECYGHLDKPLDALPLYEELAAAGGHYQELAALRLTVFYERLGYQDKKTAVYELLQRLTHDAALKRELQKKDRRKLQDEGGQQ